MSTSRKKITAKVTSLAESLDELETKLEPLFAQTLPEALLFLENLQQAKLQVLLPYLINDLIFIYLKVRGVDPKTHPVVAELDRVRRYFAKIKEAEDPEKKRTEINKAAAGRFIKHAIAQAKSGLNTTSTATHSKVDQHRDMIPPNEVGPSTVKVPVRVTSKMREREKYERELKELGSDTDDGVLEVFEDPTTALGEAELSMDDNGKTAVSRKWSSVDLTGQTRRKRPMDPFGDDLEPPVNDSAGSGSSTLLSKKPTHQHATDRVASSASPAPSNSGGRPRKAKRRKQKASTEG